MLKVLKFGGTSMADAKQFAKVKAIVESDEARKVVVVSAAGKRFSDDNKITDLLYLCHAHLKYGVSYKNVFKMVADRYIQIKEDLGLAVDIEKDLEQISKKMDKGISQDELVSRGEYLSAKLMADYLGYEFIDAANWIRFKADGTVDTDKSYKSLQKLATGKRVVIPGFYGTTSSGEVKVMSRGGSDITGALAAAALDADVYENWTDVSGILMADPRIVENPQPIERITYDELRELSYMGAQVLHEGTIFPVREKNIPLNIRNTNAPEHPGSYVMDNFDDSGDNPDQFVTGIAGKKNFSAVTISKAGLCSQIGFLRMALECFEKHKINVEYLPVGIDDITIVVSSEQLEKCEYELLAEIQRKLNPDSVNVSKGLAIIAVVGRKMANKPGMSGRLFAALGNNDVNIRLISQASRELNIIVGVNNEDFEKVVNILYKSFVNKA